MDRLSIDNAMFDELRHGFDSHLAALIRTLTQGPIRGGEVAIKLAVEVDVDTIYKSGKPIEQVKPSFKWAIVSKTAVQKFEHKGSPDGDFQVEFEPDGIRVHNQEDEQTSLNFGSGTGPTVEADFKIVNATGAPKEEAAETHETPALTSSETGGIPALPLNENVTPESWDKDPVYVCQECDFKTGEEMTQCPNCGGEMLPTDQPIERVSTMDATGEQTPDDLDKAS